MRSRAARADPRRAVAVARLGLAGGAGNERGGVRFRLCGRNPQPFYGGDPAEPGRPAGLFRLLFRFAVFALVYLLFSTFLVRYAKKVEARPEASLVADIDGKLRARFAFEGGAGSDIQDPARPAGLRAVSGGDRPCVSLYSRRPVRAGTVRLFHAGYGGDVRRRAGWRRAG